MTAKLAEVRRLLDRYLIEVVEEFGLCPWARTARTGGELAVDVLWGQPSLLDWVESAQALLDRPQTRVAMVIAPELDAAPRKLRDIRNTVATALDGVGIADFHPDAGMDAATPARLVPALRRSPDPLLQLVPLKLLDSVRATKTVIDREDVIKIIAGKMAPPRGDIGDIIASDNHARVVGDTDNFVARIGAIAEDRRQSYARAGIMINTGR
ncbi:MAG: hypothetical protein HOV81_19985 [Kofleriaceae bacterium]|nr:hypothetical protein [Kofleriaceae bacterium]